LTSAGQTKSFLMIVAELFFRAFPLNESGVAIPRGRFETFHHSGYRLRPRLGLAQWRGATGGLPLLSVILWLSRRPDGRIRDLAMSASRVRREKAALSSG
jgi:hypothetical protein